MKSHQALYSETPHKPKSPFFEEKKELEGLLWVEFLRGSDKALADIYRIYSKKLFNYGRQFTQCDELIYDTIQDVFIYLVDAREKLSVAKSVKFYLFSVFRRTLMKALEKDKKVINPDNDDFEGFLINMNNGYHPVHEIISERHKKVIMNAVNQLPARQREMLNLRFFEGMSYEQIASMMELANAKTVRTMMYRSLARLNKVLAPLKKSIYSFIVFVFAGII
ncbi:RNA polymerase sigma factor [Echinicola salinicaeni]|uniref:RNA polymerase sigma factor n=1 Tax=Echinicola salinicaeni TaxID=2762757 RepID=UPI001646B1FD|nr:sigma-70 family RNA polymerase sigma factor [Echinicola salinicaeni]